MTDPNKILGINRLLAVAAQLQTTRFARHLDKLDMTVAQFSVISHLSRQDGPVSISSVANAVEVNQPAITKMVQKFQTAGWVDVQADPSDQRARRITLTQDGLKVIGRFYALVGPEAKACFGNWSDADLDDFNTLLKRVVHWLDENRLD